MTTADGTCMAMSVVTKGGMLNEMRREQTKEKLGITVMQDE